MTEMDQVNSNSIDVTWDESRRIVIAKTDIHISDSIVVINNMEMMPDLALRVARNIITACAAMGVTPDWPEWKP